MSPMNINDGMQLFQQTEGALLIDVREPSLLHTGMIEGAKNIPFSKITELLAIAPDKSTPLFFYCTAGVMAGEAAKWAAAQGYTTAYNIGSIWDYTGALVNA